MHELAPVGNWNLRKQETSGNIWCRRVAQVGRQGTDDAGASRLCTPCGTRLDALEAQRRVKREWARRDGRLAIASHAVTPSLQDPRCVECCRNVPNTCMLGTVRDRQGPPAPRALQELEMRVKERTNERPTEWERKEGKKHGRRLIPTLYV